MIKVNAMAALNDRKRTLRLEMLRMCDAAEKEDRDFTASEQASYDVKKTEFDHLAAQLDRRIDLNPADADGLMMPDQGPWPGEPGCDEALAKTRLAARQRQTGQQEIRPGDLVFRDARTGGLLRALRSREPMAQEPIDDGEPFAVGRALHGWLTGRQDSFSPKFGATQLGGSDIAGGFLFEPRMSAMTVDLARSASVCLRAGAQTLPMESNELHLVSVTADPTGHWRPEGSTVTASGVTFGRITLRAKTLAAIVPITLELLEDAANAASLIESCISAALGLQLDQAALAGTGAASEPLGVRNTTGVNTITSVGAPTDYLDASDAIEAILTANYDGGVDRLAWLLHPRDAASYDQLYTVTTERLQPTPWVAQLQQLYTTSISTSEGVGVNESFSVIGDFSQMVIGMRTSGIVFRRLPAGTVTDSAGTSYNAVSELRENLVAYMRADVALLRPTWFTVMSGLLATA